MTRLLTSPVRHPDRFYIGGEWVAPSSSDTIDVIDSGTEDVFLTVAEARSADMARAVDAARVAFDRGPWPRMTHAERAGYLRQMGARMGGINDGLADLWSRQSGVVRSISEYSGMMATSAFDAFADLADTFAFEEVRPTPNGFGLLVHEPVGVVGAIIPWNAPLQLIPYKIGPALLAGCSVVLKLSPEAPGEGYLIGEVADEIGLPPGVLNVVTADRSVSEELVTNPGVDKITFTGSTAAGRRIASLCGERIARCTLELGGKSAAVVLDDADLDAVAANLAGFECIMTGQVCSSITRVIVTRRRHDEMVDALSSAFAGVTVGDQFDQTTNMGPLALERQRERVEGYIRIGVEEGATLATGGGRPKHLERGWFVEPTVFGDVDNSSTIAQEEIFGPVISVIPAPDEEAAVDLANDTIYGLNSSVFTPDVERARAVAGRLRSGTVGHNGFKTDFGIAFGGFKQSGLGREGSSDQGLLAFLESKTMLLDEPTRQYRDT